MKKESARLPRFVWQAVVLSFVLQVAAIGITHNYRVRASDDHFAFGWEMGCVARAIASGRGFSDPYCVPSGPSAWEPPLYPFLMAGVFKIFGTYSIASAWVLLTINSLFTALTCIPIYFIARKTMGETVAHWSVWIWALLPYTWYWSIHWIWDTTISPFLLSLIFLTALELQSWEGQRGWVLFGVLWGVVALLNPSMLSFLPFCGLWVWYRRHQSGLRSLAGVAVASAVFFLCLSPWLLRNYRTFGRFVFIRDDFGEQFRLGNGPYADGMLMAYLQPNLNVTELKRFQSLGELEYARVRKQEAVAFIRENPARFVIISCKRFVYYWSGVLKPGDSIAVGMLRNSLFLASSVLALWGLGRAVRKRVPGAWLFALLVLAYPTTYYFVFPHARYRHPLEPELIILMVYLVSEVEVRAKRTD